MLDFFSKVLVSNIGRAQAILINILRDFVFTDSWRISDCTDTPRTLFLSHSQCNIFSHLVVSIITSAIDTASLISHGSLLPLTCVAKSDN